MFKPSRISALFAVALVALFANVAPAQAVVTCLDHGHVDGVWVKVVSGNLQVFIGDHTVSPTVERNPADVVLKAKPASQGTVPASPNPACQGTPGNPVWILPQTENDLVNGLLWLGWSAESISSGVLVGNQVTLKLTDAHPETGTGVFCGFTKSGFTTTKLFDSSDGYTSADSVAIPVGAGGHRHLNWAFTKSGNWSLTFEVSGTPVGGSLQTVSKTYSFAIGSTC
jgi:surface-anchored protein